jgi:hypothetical protein
MLWVPSRVEVIAPETMLPNAPERIPAERKIMKRFDLVGLDFWNGVWAEGDAETYCSLFRYQVEIRKITAGFVAVSVWARYCMLVGN